MRQLLHRLKFVYKKAKTIPGKANAELQEALDRSGDLEQNLGKLRAIPILFSFTTGLSEWLIHKSIGQESFQCLG
jgi:hypothetical protein